MTPLSPHPDGDHAADWSHPHSAELSRRTSAEDHSQPHTPPGPQHAEYLNMEQLSKVPSYSTATRAPLPRTPSFHGSLALPDHRTAISAPGSPSRLPQNDTIATISENVAGANAASSSHRSRSASRTRQNNAESVGFHYLPHSALGEASSEQRLRVSQSRGG
jgi:hypothetical protein